MKLTGSNPSLVKLAIMKLQETQVKMTCEITPVKLLQAYAGTPAQVAAGGQRLAA